jgi:hypothetical protein
MSSELSNRILRSMNAEVLSELDLCNSIKHPGENGRGRENVVSRFLRRLVPDKFCIDTGFVFDAAGQMSLQQDLVIYRKDYCPTFEIGGIKHYPVECVVAVIENKASVASNDKLSAALHNIESVKKLDRSNCGRNWTLSGGTRREAINKDCFEHQIWGAILTETSLAKQGLLNSLLHYCRNQPKRQLWPNLYVDLRGPTVRYTKTNPEGQTFTTRTAEARRICITEATSAEFTAPLIEFTYELLNFLRIAPLIDYLPSTYIGMEIGPTQSEQI